MLTEEDMAGSENFNESLRLLCLDPASFNGWLGVVDAEASQNSPSKLLIICRRAIVIGSNSADSLLAIAMTAIKRDQKALAIQCLSKLITIDPAREGLHLDLGAMLEASSHDGLAAYFYRREALLSPGDPRPWFNLGNVAMSQGDPSASAGNYDEALARGLTSTFGYKAAALAHLIAGNFSRGWSLYETRFVGGNVSVINKSRMLISNKPLLGKSLDGYAKSSVLVWAEQGIGDEIMFGSMLKEFQDRVGRLIVQVDARLIPLFRRSFPVEVLFFDRADSVPESYYDAHVAIGSLGKYLRPTINSFSNSRRYLYADAGRVLEIRESMKLGSGEIAIGISWQSSNRDTGNVRSISLSKMAKALHFPRVRLVNLQYGTVDDEIKFVEASLGIQIMCFPAVNNTTDLDGLAAIIEACDQVVSIGNATAHLAGALGKKTTVLLPRIGARTADGAIIPGWRWLDSGGRCVWYESVELMKSQVHESNWDYCLLRLREHLATQLDL